MRREPLSSNKKKQNYFFDFFFALTALRRGAAFLTAFFAFAFLAIVIPFLWVDTMWSVVLHIDVLNWVKKDTAG